MKVVIHARANLHRLKKFRSWIIAACDASSAGFIAYALYSLLMVAKDSAFFLSKVILNNELMVRNPSVTHFNISMFEQAEQTLIQGSLVTLAVSAFVLALIAYVRWTLITNTSFKKQTAIQYVLSKTLWNFLMIVLLFIFTFKILDIVSYPLALGVIIVGMLHLNLSHSLGLARAKRFKPRKFLEWFSSTLSVGFNQFWEWSVGYGFLLVIITASLLIYAVLFPLGNIALILFAVILFLGLTWWRMTLVDLLDDAQKKKSTQR